MGVAVTVDVSPFLVNSAGVKTYLYHWLRSLITESRGRLDVRTFPVAYSGEPLRHERSLFGPVGTFRGLAHLGLRNRGLIPPLATNDSIFHATQLVHCPPSARALTATLHDVTYVLFPEMHTAGTIECHRRFDDAVLPLCRRVFCMSRATADDAVRLLRLPEKRVTVVYQGVEDRFFHARDGIAGAREALTLPAHFILCLGTIEPRKNVDTLLSAFLELPEDIRTAFPLVFAGGAGWKSEQLLARIHSNAPHVRYLGYVAEEHLPGLIGAADVLAYPSLYEGFGIPLVQAMAAGTAVLTSGVSSMPEVVGDAGRLIEPRSVASIRAGLLELLTSPAHRAELSSRGEVRARKFTWSRCARQSVQIFEEVAGEL